MIRLLPTDHIALYIHAQGLYTSISRFVHGKLLWSKFLYNWQNFFIRILSNWFFFKSVFSSLSGVIRRRHQHSGTSASSSSSWEPVSIWWGTPWITDWLNWGISFTSLSETTPWCSRYNHVVWYGNRKTKSCFWNWPK